MSVATVAGIELIERGWLPDVMTRWGIRQLVQERLRQENRGSHEANRHEFESLVAELRASRTALHPESPNQQHYELPPTFFQKVLGPRMKYSACYWPDGVRSLDRAEEAMLRLTCERAELADGMDVLDLGCGWGSLTFWVAERYRRSTVLAVSNSRLQRQFIESESQRRGLNNVDVLTADMNRFHTERRFDRIISVEMFEHMRNYEELLARIAGWLKLQGKLFIHVFAHRRFAYRFENDGAGNWMGRYFFTGGLMPSENLLLQFQRNLQVEERWWLDGTHYEQTAEAWLAHMDARQEEVLAVLKEFYGLTEARRWLARWRVFFMACAELFGYSQGREWGVGHYRFTRC